MLELVLSTILGAVIGALATYLASYVLEKEKWRANAALLRKKEVYGPIYDELVLMEHNLKTQRNSYKPIQQGPLFREWLSLRNSSSALTMPDQLRNRLDAFVPICDQYIPELNSLYAQIHSAFPDNLRSQGILDSQVASRLAEIMLVAPEADYQVFTTRIKLEYPHLDELAAYWSKDRIQKTLEIIRSLSAWSSIVEIQSQYSKQLTDVKSELFQHIQNIVKTYQRPKPRF